MPDREYLVEEVASLAREDEALGLASERRLSGTATAADEALSHDMPDSLIAPLSRERERAVVDAIESRIGRAGNVRRLRRAAGGAVAVSAIAAGVLLWVMSARNIDGLVPPYEARVEGGIQSQRSGERLSAPSPQPLWIQPGTMLRFELRPHRDVRGSVRARAFVREAGNEGSSRQELVIAQQESPAGALRVELRVPSTLPAAGELLLYLGRRGAVEGDLADASDLQTFRFSFKRAP